MITLFALIGLYIIYRGFFPRRPVSVDINFSNNNIGKPESNPYKPTVKNTLILLFAFIAVSIYKFVVFIISFFKPKRK
ncbi:MAG: hypothetical protein LBT27_05495 [Prevotellaceae bacterium]|jgi:hypothetical protein|nr:hypothetical protein [Prevotellaceae bacterium]